MSGGVVTPPRLPRRTGPLPDLDAVIQRATQLRNKLDQYQVRALRRTPCDYLLPRHRVATHAAPCQRACAHLGAAGAVRQWLHGQLGAASAASPNCLLDPRAGTASRARALHCACEQMPRGVSPRNVAGEPRSAARHRRGTRAGQRVAGAARQRGPARRERWLRGLSSDRALLLHTSSRTQLATTREGCCCSSRRRCSMPCCPSGQRKAQTSRSASPSGSTSGERTVLWSMRCKYGTPLVAHKLKVNK